MFPNWSNSVSLQQELYISEGLYSRRFIMIECDHGMKNIFYRRFSPIIPLTIARYFVSTPVKIYFEGEIERIRWVKIGGDYLRLSLSLLYMAPLMSNHILFVNIILPPSYCYSLIWYGWGLHLSYLLLPSHSYLSLLKGFTRGFKEGLFTRGFHFILCWLDPSFPACLLRGTSWGVLR